MPPDYQNIYNSRNYSILLNLSGNIRNKLSTTVEIILYYLTMLGILKIRKSTTVEIILYYLTAEAAAKQDVLQQ